jgi:isoleucyl-tRNA synthetase
VTETARKLFSTLRNVTAFLATYANVDGWIPASEAPPLAERPPIDRWLLSRLDATSIAVRDALRNYQLTRAARALAVFVQDELSNWYVRRNRRRFWKGERGPDKNAAYATLHEALVTVSRLLAPFAPFLAETLHRTLVTPFDPESPVSVHLCRFPAPGSDRRDEALEKAMAVALEVTEAGRAARAQAGLKVRQPLRRLLVMGGARVSDALTDIVLEELNVKTLEHAGSEAAMTASLKPDFKTLGPRFGGQVNLVAKTLRALDDTAVREGISRGSWTVHPEGMDVIEVTPAEAAVVESPREGFALAGSGEIQVALDVALDDALRGEGNIRELVHQIQNQRKEQGLEVTDRVRLVIGAGPGLREAVTAYRDLIRSEVLALELEVGDIPDGAPVGDVDGIPVSVTLARA